MLLNGMGAGMQNRNEDCAGVGYGEVGQVLKLNGGRREAEAGEAADFGNGVWRAKLCGPERNCQIQQKNEIVCQG